MPNGTTTRTSAYWLAVAGLVALAVALRVMLYDRWDQYHADEFYQYLEQGHRLADGWGLVPWEGRLGVRSALIPQCLALPWKLGELLGPATLAPIDFARGAFAALSLLGLAGAWGIGRARSSGHALAALLVAAVWYESAFFGVALLSESAATALIAAGAAVLLDRRSAATTLRAAGFLLMLGVLIRLQYAPFVAVLVGLTVLADLRAWRELAIGGLIALALGALSDLVAHQTPFAWAFAAVSANLGHGIAARFGTEGPLFYLRMLLSAFGPAAPAILIAALFAGRRYWPLIAATLVNLVVHSLIAHKEPRFVWLSTFMILVLASIATVNALDWLVARRKLPPMAQWTGLAIVLGLWGALAWTSYRSGAERLPRTGGAYAMAAHDVAGRPQICGLAVPEEWHNSVTTAFLGRNVPLYVMPVELLGGLSPLPDELAGSANAVLNDGDLMSNPEYAVASCHERGGQKACLLVREGGCDASAGKAYEAQAWMNEKNL